MTNSKLCFKFTHLYAHLFILIHFPGLSEYFQHSSISGKNRDLSNLIQSVPVIDHQRIRLVIV